MELAPYMFPLPPPGAFGQLIFIPPPMLPDLAAYEGSNFLAKLTYFSRSYPKHAIKHKTLLIKITIFVTDFLALFSASSKCFLEISGTGS